MLVSKRESAQQVLGLTLSSLSIGSVSIWCPLGAHWVLSTMRCFFMLCKDMFSKSNMVKIHIQKIQLKNLSTNVRLKAKLAKCIDVCEQSKSVTNACKWWASLSMGLAYQAQCQRADHSFANKEGLLIASAQVTCRQLWVEGMLPNFISWFPCLATYSCQVSHNWWKVIMHR